MKTDFDKLVDLALAMPDDRKSRKRARNPVRDFLLDFADAYRAAQENVASRKAALERGEHAPRR